MKNEIIELISKETKLKREEVEKLIEIPPTEEMGDFAFPCFSLAKIEKKSPLLIAENLAEKLRKNLPKEISGVEVKSAYVNFFLDKKILAKKVLEEVLKKKQKFGKNEFGKGKKIVIDMSSPNIAKPFGIGHLRSTIIGNAISEIAKSNGYKTIKINYLGDWGTQFGKLIVGFNHWGDEKKLKNNPIEHLLEIYVKANAEEYEQEARDEFKKLEEGDKKNLKLWKEFRDFSLVEFNEIYKFLGVEFDVLSGESLYNDKMEGVIKKLEAKKLLKESEGAQVVDLENENLGVVLIKKNDGTSLYATRDLTAAIDRYKEYQFDKMIYEVGQEQKLHFKQVFRVLKLLGYNFADNCVHVAHGLYLGDDGKKFATRKGKTVKMREVINETYEIAKENLLKRDNNLSKLDLEHKARAIALSAIIYGDLKNYRENDMVFDLDKFLEFEGNTGPYLLYSYARASSIIRKTAKAKKTNEELFDLSSHESSLLKQIEKFPQTVQQAYEQLAPNIIANYSYELCQKFNEFYHSCQVIGSKEENFRLNLIDAFRIVLKNSLSLLGISVLDEM
jgi:arginyl-tRNA synthetase